MTIIFAAILVLFQLNLSPNHPHMDSMFFVSITLVLLTSLSGIYETLVIAAKISRHLHTNKDDVQNIEGITIEGEYTIN